MHRVLIGAAIILGMAHTAYSKEAQYPITPEQVSFVQTIMFEMGFSAYYPDGKMGADTRQAIEKYQTENNLAVRGYFTKEEFDRFSSRSLPNRIRGAISASIEGAFHAVWNAPSSIEAFDEARKKCSQLAKRCVTLAGQHWLVAAICTKQSTIVRADGKYLRTQDAVYVQPGQTRADALQSVYDKASGDVEAYRKSDCKIISIIAANGAHNK